MEDERIEVVDGKSVGLHIQDWGQKLWIFDLLSEAPALAPTLAANAAVKRYVSELVERPALGLFAARYQWKGAESRIHGSFVRSAEVGPGVRAGSVVDSTGSAPAFRVTTEGADRTPRLQSSAFRLMYMLSDIEPGGGALRVLPGSHKRDVAWRPGGAELRTHPGEENHALARYEELRPDQQELFVELTGKAGTAVIFTHDLIHTSWHETDTYRRVVHLTFGSGYAHKSTYSYLRKGGDLFEYNPSLVPHPRVCCQERGGGTGGAERAGMAALPHARPAGRRARAGRPELRRKRRPALMKTVHQWDLVYLCYL